MSKYNHSFGKFLIALLFFLVLPSFLLTLVIPLVKYSHELVGLPLYSGILYLSVPLIFLIFSNHFKNNGQLVFRLLLVSLLLKVFLIYLLRDFPQIGDVSTFHAFVSQLATGGLNRTNISNLSTIFYDYYNWFPRSFPFNYFIAKLYGKNDILCTQLFNTALSLLNICLFYFICKKIIHKKTILRYAVILFSFMPLHYWYILQYTHRIQAEFFLLSIFLVFINLANLKSIFWIIINLLLFILLLFCLHLQAGLDYVLLMSIFIYLLYKYRYRIKHSISIDLKVIFLCCVIVVGYVLTIYSFDSWKSSCNVGQLSSGIIGFTARGWSLDTLGEYCAEYEKIDRATPPEIKKRVMVKLILSSIYYNPLAIFCKLIPSKIAKFFLVGYATNFRESLSNTAYPRLSSVFLGTRLLFAPLFLLLVLLGCINIIRIGVKNTDYLFIIISFTLIMLFTFVLFGEASPTYSYYLYFSLCIVAAYGLFLLTSPSKATIVKQVFKKYLIKYCIFFLVGYLIIAVLLVTVIRISFADLTFENISNRTISVFNLKNILLNPRNYIVRELKFPTAIIKQGENLTIKFILPEFSPFNNKKDISFYIINSTSQENRFDNLNFKILLNGVIIKKVAFKSLSNISRISCDLSSLIEPMALEFELENITDKSLHFSSKDIRIKVGYLSFD